MKRQIVLITTIVTVAISLSAIISFAQDPGGDRRPGSGPGRPRPMSPVIAALDANKDGKIDANEIANASNALKTLDKNNDGELTPDEFAGPPPGGERGGPGGPQRRPPPQEQ